MGRYRLLSEDQEKELVELRKQGMSYPKLAKHFNIPCSTIQYYYKRALEEKPELGETALKESLPGNLEQLKGAIYEVKIIDQLKEISDLAVEKILVLLKSEDEKFKLKELGGVLSMVIDKIKQFTPYGVKDNNEGDSDLKGFTTKQLIARSIELKVYTPGIPDFMNTLKKGRKKKATKTPEEPEDAEFEEIKDDGTKT